MPTTKCYLILSELSRHFLGGDYPSLSTFLNQLLIYNNNIKRVPQLGNTDIYHQTKCRYELKRAQEVNAANLETFPNIHINGSTAVKPVNIQ